MAEHTWDTQVKRDTPVSIHFNLPGHTPENILFQIIDILLSEPESDTSTITQKVLDISAPYAETIGSKCVWLDGCKLQWFS